jgi:alkylation response protein AidB-like acyl-CoA dehydrogenase
MRFAFDADTLEIARSVADTLAGACPPTRVRAAWQARDVELRGLLAELGLLALNLPEDAGGLGLGPTGWVLPAEAVGRHAAPVALVETLATNPTLVELGLTELAEAVAVGDAFVSLANDGDYAADADLAARVFRVHAGRVEVADAPVLTPQRSVDGARRLFHVGGPWSPVDADPRGLSLRASLAAASQLVGLARAILQLAVDYAKVRRQFGKPIGAFQAVQHHLVDALLKLEFAAPAVHRAAWELEHDTADAELAVRAAKLFASEAADLASRKSLQVHGAIGYTLEHDLHLWMKPAWVLSASWGAPRAQIAALKSHVLGDAHA